MVDVLVAGRTRVRVWVSVLEGGHTGSTNQEYVHRRAHAALPTDPCSVHPAVRSTTTRDTLAERAVPGSRARPRPGEQKKPGRRRPGLTSASPASLFALRGHSGRAALFPTTLWPAGVRDRGQGCGAEGNAPPLAQQRTLRLRPRPGAGGRSAWCVPSLRSP